MELHLGSQHYCKGGTSSGKLVLMADQLMMMMMVVVVHKRSNPEN
ncbi:hypothetical protein CY35_05G074600 [Sphagnum magellanicum]|nr:hypothetical protein CY35_05G074600 [Sphagnum magellanicum]